MRAAGETLWDRFPVPSGSLPYHCVSGRHRPVGEASPRRPKGRLEWGMRVGTYVGPWWGRASSGAVYGRSSWNLFESSLQVSALRYVIVWSRFKVRSHRTLSHTLTASSLLDVATLVVTGAALAAHPTTRIAVTARRLCVGWCASPHSQASCVAL